MHTNAAFCRLTGIDSHHVVGKSISDLLFIPESSSNRCTRMHRAETFQHSESAEQMGGVVSGVSGYEDDQDLCNDAIGSHSEKCGNTPLERLIATCGFGHISIVHVFTKLDWLVGQQVTTVVKGGTMKRQHVDTRDQQSSHTVAGDNSALTDGTCTCRISIAPIISSDASVNSGMSIENKADSVVAKSHRGKPAVDHDPSRNSEAKGLVKLNNKYLPLQRVTHFVIQLHAEGEGFGKQNASMESLSSNSSSVEANLLGLSKQEMHLQKYTIGACRRQGDHSVPDEDIPTVDNNNNSDVYAAAEEGIEEDDVDLEAYSVTSEVDAVAAVG